MKHPRDLKFVLTSGSKVREEDFGLLFYSMYGPRLFFINCKKNLSPEFFAGECDLKEWLIKKGGEALASAKELASCLQKLAEEGVIRGA